MQHRFFCIRSVKCFASASVTLVLLISIAPVAECQSAAKLLKEGSRYQAADDTSDQAADLYRQLIRKYPKSAEAESAQFFLGAYYERKFFILEHRSKVPDWGSLNRAEEELYTYKGKYPRGFYVADAFHMLAIAALRRGYKDTARNWWTIMREASTKDRQVYIFRITWSSSTDDVIKGYCKTSALAAASVDALNKESSFDGVVRALTSWARGNCH